MGFFEAAHVWRGGGGKKPPYLKSVTHILQWWSLAHLYLSQGRSKKYMNHMKHTLIFADISVFLSEISKFCYIKKYRYKIVFWYVISIYFTFSWVFIDFYKKHCYNFDDVSKTAAAALLKIKIFWNKGYYAIYSAYDVTNKILSHHST